MQWLRYQTHLSQQACHLARATEGAIAAVNSSPLHIYPPKAPWILFISPQAFLSAHPFSPIVPSVFQGAWMLRAPTVGFYLSLVCLCIHAFMRVSEKQNSVYTDVYPHCHESLECAMGFRGSAAGEPAKGCHSKPADY